jgi:hypothetical protein
MFKIIFKGITIFFFIVFLMVSLAIWKGGEPFRWLGDGLVIMGRTITDFGDTVDDFIKGSKEVRKNVEKIKEVISPDKDENR